MQTKGTPLSVSAVNFESASTARPVGKSKQRSILSDEGSVFNGEHEMTRKDGGAALSPRRGEVGSKPSAAQTKDRQRSELRRNTRLQPNARSHTGSTLTFLGELSPPP